MRRVRARDSWTSGIAAARRGGYLLLIEDLGVVRVGQLIPGFFDHTPAEQFGGNFDGRRGGAACEESDGDDESGVFHSRLLYQRQKVASKQAQGNIGGFAW